MNLISSFFSKAIIEKTKDKNDGFQEDNNNNESKKSKKKTKKNTPKPTQIIEEVKNVNSTVNTTIPEEISDKKQIEDLKKMYDDLEFNYQ